jgi:serine/threonine protein kinase
MSLSSGSRLGPYEILAPIGAGGMGEVYRARDTRLEREVAVKVLPERVANDPAALARFEREARTVAGLNDPHVCSLFDFGIEGDVHFAVFELLEGDTLRERLSRGALSPSKAVELAMQMCQGLAAAHAKGIVHRDVKPENLFLTPKGLKILDFGLAKLQPMGVGAGEGHLSEEPTLSAHEQLTGPGMAPGTAAYMSPEQARGEPADARSDIFATGVAPSPPPPPFSRTALGRCVGRRGRLLIRRSQPFELGEPVVDELDAGDRGRGLRLHPSPDDKPPAIGVQLISARAECDDPVR